MPTLAEHKSLFGVRFIGKRNNELDDKAIAVLNKLADIAEPHGVEIAIYPHVKDYTETTTECLRLVTKVNRPKTVGVIFNLCHWQNVASNGPLETVLKEAGSWLKGVNINGASKTRAITRPLGEGDFNNSVLLAILNDINYQGPIGLICWGLKGDMSEHLTKSMNAWLKMNPSKK